VKKLRVFAHQTEAQLAKSLLASHGIRAEILGDVGSFTVVVAENRLDEARRIVDEVLVKDGLLAKPKTRPNHFKKGIMFALGAPILIPVVFNYFSLYHAWKYWENSHKETGDMLKVALIVALNIPTYFIIKYAFNMVGDLTSMMGLPADGGTDF
jgi:hypothetical protein